MKTTRRRFLCVAGAWGCVIAAGILSSRKERTALPALRHPVLDCHVHLFATGDAPGLSDNERPFLSPVQRRHWTHSYLRRLLRLSRGQPLDLKYVERLVAQLRASSIERAVLLAQDGRYTEQGRLDLRRTTSIYVPNHYLFRIVRQYPDLFVPCPSINPKRADAFEELAYCFDQGARVLKIHPPTQDVDPGDARFRPFFRRCAQLGVVVMVHTGTEHSAEIVGHEYSNPRRLALVLDEGCRVVACHAGMGAFFDKEDFYPDLTAMMRQYPNLYCDTAVLGSLFRWRNLPRMLENPLVTSRMIHGSDFPFPSNALAFWNRLGWADLWKLSAEQNLLQRDLELKRSLGVPPEVFSRGADLLGLTRTTAENQPPIYQSNFR